MHDEYEAKDNAFAETLRHEASEAGYTHEHTHTHGSGVTDTAHEHSHGSGVADAVHEHTHTHGSGDGDHAHGHTHTHGHSHTHTHDPEDIKAIVNRLKRSVGHLDKVRRMVEDGEDCSDVLIQLSAVKSEINNTGKLILKEHMEHCIVEAVRENDHEAIERMNEAIDRFMK